MASVADSRQVKVEHATYLGMKTVVDSKSESTLKKLQAASESAARDENTAIEVGKITTAKFALFTKVRKTGANYVVAVDFTDLTTGVQMASCMSKSTFEGLKEKKEFISTSCRFHTVIITRTLVCVNKNARFLQKKAAFCIWFYRFALYNAIKKSNLK